MRKDLFKKTAAVAMSFALVATMLCTAGNMVKADGEEAQNLLTGADWIHVHNPYEQNDALISGTRVADNDANGFTANITMTGWQREWYGVDYMPDDAWPWQGGWCDNPYQLNSSTDVAVESKSTYRLQFEIENNMKDSSGNPTEKNVTVTVNSGIEGDSDNTLMFTTVRAAANGTYKFDKKFTVPEDWSLDKVHIQIAYGAYAYSYEISASPFLKLMPADIREKYCFAPGTKENVNAVGKLAFNQLSLTKVAYEEPTTVAPEEPTTVKPEEPTTIKPNETITKPDNTKVTKPAKASLKTVKNVKGKKLSITWKKVNGAKKYQVKAVVGKKTVTKLTSKTKITLKGLKKGKTYKVSVRAKNTAGYGAWSKVRKVKIKK